MDFLWFVWSFSENIKKVKMYLVNSQPTSKFSNATFSLIINVCEFLNFVRALRNKRIRCKHMLFVSIFYLHVYYPKCNLWFFQKMILCIILNWITSLPITKCFNKCIHFLTFLHTIFTSFNCPNIWFQNWQKFRQKFRIISIRDTCRLLS